MANADGIPADSEAAASESGPETKQDAGATQCADCQEAHCEPARCSNCGACLYEHSTQVKDPTYPLFRCKLCQQVNFWD